MGLDWQTEQNLNDLFAQDRQRREDALTAAEKAALAIERDIACFVDIRENVLRPELEKIAAFVISRGWDAQVVSSTAKKIHPDSVGVPEIAIYFARDKVDQWKPEQFAHARFYCVPGSFKIAVSESDVLPGKGGSASSGQSYEMNNVDAQWVSSRVTKLLTTLLQK